MTFPFPPGTDLSVASRIVERRIEQYEAATGTAATPQMIDGLFAEVYGSGQASQACLDARACAHDAEDRRATNKSTFEE